MRISMNNDSRRKAGRIRIILLAVLFLIPAGVTSAWGAEYMNLRTQAPQTVQLTAGKSIIVNTGFDVSRVSLASPEHVDIVLISPRQIYLTGKQVGATNLTLWGKNGNVAGVYDVAVSPDVDRLKHMIHNVLPGESGIQVMAAGESITLAGGVTSVENLNTAVSLAEAFSPDKDKVVNLLRVGGVHQVILEVKIAEMDRSEAKRFGFNFQAEYDGKVFSDQLNKLSWIDPDKGTMISEHINLIAPMSFGAATLVQYFDALKKDGLVRILAEPNLICLSGQEGNFLAGGEIPVPVPQQMGAIGIEYKKFGVGLTFTPRVLNTGRISMQVQPEVSELDYTNTVTISGWVIPAITTRRASTTVELEDGQSFAIAGLIKDSMREDASKFPVLGDLPILGSLFRSMEYQKQQSELLIIVTPHLAKPLDMAGQTLPTDGFKEPTDYEFYMLGLIDGRGEVEADAIPDFEDARPVPGAHGQGTGFDGDFGHALPQ